MILLPVVERELRVAARGRAAYRVRFYAVLLTLALVLWFVAFSGKDQTAGGFGMELMVLLTIPAFITRYAGCSVSRKPVNWRMRVGCRILRKALASIWRMRSRVTLNCLPTSSRVRE